jgi:Co/Zn/Cd efflux system component
MNEEIEHNIQNKIESEDDNKVSDIHVWKVGPGHYAAIISIVTHAPKGASHYKNMISEFSDISHLTIEVNECD